MRARAWLTFGVVAALTAPCLAQSLEIRDTVFDDGDGSQYGLRGASVVAVGPDGKHVYAASPLGGVAVFSLDDATGEVDHVETWRDGDGGADNLESIRGLAVSPDGKHVYVAALLSSAITVFSRDAASGRLTFVEDHVDNTGGVDGLAGAWDVAVSPDGEHVYVVSSSENAIAAFTRDATTGSLVFEQALFDDVGGVDGLEQVNGIALSRDGMHVYTVSGTELISTTADDAVAVFERDAGTGLLTFLEAHFDGQGRVDGLEQGSAIVVSGDGRNVYAAGGIDDVDKDWLAVFARRKTGHLKFLQTLAEPPAGPCDTGIGSKNGLTISRDDTIVYATISWQSAVVALARDPRNGKLSYPSQKCTSVLEGLYGARDVAAAPNGDVLAAVFGDNAVTSLRPIGTPGLPIVTDIAPAVGTTGTVITISGLLLADKKRPQLTLSRSKVRTLRPWSATEVRVLVKRPLPIGLYDLTIDARRKGVLGEFVKDAFSFVGPTLVTATPPAAGAGTLVTLEGTHFGAKRGKLFLVPAGSGKDIKVKVPGKAWRMDPTTGTSGLVFKVPKNAPVGVHTLRLENAVFEAEIPFEVR